MLIESNADVQESPSSRLGGDSQSTASDLFDHSQEHGTSAIDDENSQPGFGEVVQDL